MKKYIIPFLIFAVASLTSCLDDQYMELDKGDNVLALATSDSVVVLNESSHSSDALELTWTTGTNYGTGNKILYTLELAKAGTGFASPYVAVNSEARVYSWTQTVEELNNLVRDEFNAQPGKETVLEARVTATVAGMDDESLKQTDELGAISVTAYEPVTSTLYLIGDATPNSWSADDATEMTRTDNGIFTWTGHLVPGEFKMITTLGQFLPSYNNSGDGSTLFYRTSDDEEDGKFVIVKDTFYKVDANLLDMTLTVTETVGTLPPAFENLYLIGDCTGWGFVQMASDPLDPYLFRHGRVFDAVGEFKFGTTDGSWENNYKAVEEAASITDTRMMFVSGFDPDYKWKLKDNEINKAYKICVDIRDGNERMMMTEFTPYEMIYLVGDATPGGWSLDIATPMNATDDPYVFTWEGNMNAGELKFTCDKKSDWNGAWFMASEENKAPTGEVEQMLFIDKSSDACKAQYLDTAISDVDLKWKLPEAGYYTITLNQLEETITIVKK